VTLDDVAAGLASSDPETRRRAAGRLVSESGERAAALLIQALGDGDWRVRKEATSVAMSLAPSPDILRALVETFAPTEENVGLRNAAVEALGGYGAAAVDALGVLVHELDPDGRKLSAEALGKTGEAGALLLLRTLMEDRDPNVCAAAVEAVAAIGATRIDEVAPLLLHYLRVPDAILRLSALNGLNQLGVVIRWEDIEELLRDPILESAALVAAGRGADPLAAESLVGALAKTRHTVRSAALRALVDFVRGGAIAFEAARGALQRLPATERERLITLADEPANALDERRAALVVLGALGTREAARVAVRALADEQVNAEAEEAVLALGPFALPALLENIRRAEGRQCAAAIGLAAQLTDQDTYREVTQTVLPALTGGSDDDTEAALVALARVGDRRALHPIARLLGAQSVRVRRAAAEALADISRRYPDAAREFARSAGVEATSALAAAVIHGALKAPVRGSVEEDLAFLSAAVSADDMLLRRAALDALAALDSPQAVEVVAFALTDEELEVRRAAVRSLGAMQTQDGTPAGLEPLFDLIRRRPETELLVEAITALGQAGDPRALQVLRPLLYSTDAFVAVQAVESVGRLHDPARAEILSEGLEHPDPEVVKSALQTLADGVDPIGQRQLARCLGHEAWDVRRLAADLLGRVGGQAALGPLRMRLSEERDPLVRQTIQRALAELESADTTVRRTTPPPSRER